MLTGTWSRFVLSILSVVSLPTFVASFGADIWNPRKVGSHSTDEQSRDQRVKWTVVYERVRSVWI